MQLKFKYRLAVYLLNLISKTWRIKIKGDFPEKPAIILFWHGKMLPVWRIFRKHNPKGVVSKSKDGQILSSLLEKWNFSLIRGSSSSDGKEVLKQMISEAENSYLLMTPDGPRGPSKEMKAGGVIAAHRSKVPLYLCGVKIKNKFLFEKSWDNFNLPLPFSNIILNFSEKCIIREDSERSDIAGYISDLELKLKKLDVD